MPNDAKHWNKVEKRRIAAEAELPAIEQEVRQVNEYVASLFASTTESLAPIEEEEEE